eukprot:scaffold1752_cov363-Pavlova_lutheri.AAC.1
MGARVMQTAIQEETPMFQFRLNMNDQYVRYTREYDLNRAFYMIYALTFDPIDSGGSTNPIAVFQPDGSNLKEVSTGLYVYFSPHQWHAVLVPKNKTSIGKWELVNQSSPNVVHVRNPTVAQATGQLRYLGAGDGVVGGDCPVAGIVKHVNVDGNGVMNGWCTKLDFTIVSESESGLEGILEALPSFTCVKDVECHEHYNTRSMLCKENVCVLPEPVPCEWQWDDWSECLPSTSDPNYFRRTRGWSFIVEPEYGGACDAPNNPYEMQETSCVEED